MERRCAWLELVAEELDLDNVWVWRGRGKRLFQGQFGILLQPREH